MKIKKIIATTLVGLLALSSNAYAAYYEPMYYNGTDYGRVFNSRDAYYGSFYDFGPGSYTNGDLRNAFSGPSDAGLRAWFAGSGIHEWRVNKRDFDPVVYKERYPDLKNAYGNDAESYYKHYMNWGWNEGRSGDGRYFLYFYESKSSSSPLGHLNVGYQRSAGTTALTGILPNTGRQFLGWEDANGNLVYGSNSRAVNGKYWSGDTFIYDDGRWTGDTTVKLYPRWGAASTTTPVEDNNWTIILMSNGGMFADYTSGVKNVAVKQGLTNGSMVSRALKAGRTFIGYYDADGNQIFDQNGNAVDGIYWSSNKWQKGYAASRTVTAYARWDTNDYTIKYDPNGAAGESIINDAMVNEEVVIAQNPYQKPNHKFIGWNTKADGTGKVYLPGEKTSNVTLAGEIVLYAQWSKSDAIIKFDSNAETGVISGEMSDLECVLNEETVLPECSYVKTTINGESTFLGWSFNKIKDNDVFKPGSKIKMTENTTLYAIWDDYPNFDYVECPDRYFTIAEAQAGAVTESELLSTVRVTDDGYNLKTHLRSEYDGGEGIALVGFNPEDFRHYNSVGGQSVRYMAVDRLGQTTYLDIFVYIVENKDQKGKPNTRCIDAKYYDKENGSPLSEVWYKEKASIIESALNENTSIAKYSFTPEDAKEYRESENKITSLQKYKTE